MNKNKKTLIYLLLFSIFMFGFTFILIPFYNVMCKALGINGKTNTTSIANKNKVDLSRSISIQFLATTNAELPWQFYPENKEIKIHPGENTKIYYTAKNNSDHTMTAQAVPSVTPGLASKYFQKIECFCFRHQTLQAHQSIKMPVIFFLAPQLPKNIHEITLSYTMYKIK